MYLHFFKAFFPLLKKLGGYKLQVKHIHGEGLIGITVDMEWITFTGKYLLVNYNIIIELLIN